MARTGITRDDVFKAAEALVADDQTPTVVAVRTFLGGGSPNNITPWLAEWREQNDAKKVDPTPAVPAAVDAAMRQVWVAAWKSSQEQLDAERDAVAKVRQEIEQERADMLGEINRLDDALEEAQARVRSAEEALEAERRSHEQTRAEVREARALAEERDGRIAEQAGELRASRRQAEEHLAQATRLEAEIGHLRGTLESAQSENGRLVQELQAAQGEAQREAEARSALERSMAQARNDIERLGRELQEAQGRARREAEARADLAQDLEHSQADNARLSREVESAKETGRHAKVALDAGAKKIEKLEGLIDEERRARAAADKAQADLQAELAVAKERAAHADELRRLFASLRQGKPADGEG